MSLPGVMQHLAVLEASGLVISEKVGRTRTCRIEPKVLSQAEHWIAERTRSLLITLMWIGFGAIALAVAMHA